MLISVALEPSPYLSGVRAFGGTNTNKNKIMMNDPDLLNEVFWFCVGLGFLFAALMALVAKKEIKAYDRAFKQIVREQEALGVHGPNTPYVSKNTKIIEGEI